MSPQIKLIVKKVIELVLTLLVVSFMTFCAFNIIPGNPASVILGPNASPEQIASLEDKLGLNAPLITRYLGFLKGAITFDPGDSISFGEPVIKLIGQRLPVTLGMSFLALLLVILVSYPISILSSSKPGKASDNIISVISHTLFAIPPFVLSMLVILFASSVLHLFAVGNYYSPSESFILYIRSLLLPSICIALPKIAMVYKFLRSSFIEELSSDYVKSSRSHGLSEARIFIRHVIPNSMVSTITVISLVLSDIMGGSIIVEQVFNLPGLGRLLVTAIGRRDFPLLSGMVLYLAFITVLLYFACDILSALIDPRMRIGREGQ